MTGEINIAWLAIAVLFTVSSIALIFIAYYKRWFLLSEHTRRPQSLPQRFRNRRSLAQLEHERQRLSEALLAESNGKAKRRASWSESESESEDERGNGDVRIVVDSWEEMDHARAS